MSWPKSLSVAVAVVTGVLPVYVLAGGTIDPQIFAGVTLLLASALAAALYAAPFGPRTPNAVDDLAASAGREQKAEREAAARLLAGIPDPALILDPASMIVQSNAAAGDLIRSAPSSHITASLRAPDLLAAIERARRTGAQVIAEFDLAVPVERSLTAVVTPMLRAADATAAPDLLLVLRDKTAEEQLAQLRADFVANASHELRTPLASVKGFVETLQGAAKDDPIARDQFLNIMLEQANRMSRLIDDLLSLSHIELREHLPPRDQVDLGELARSVCYAMAPIAKSDARTLTFLPPPQPVTVTGDRDELEQLLQNLIQNAIKYGKPQGFVEVAVSAANRTAVISVRDDGIGIAPHHIPRLTERFYRVSAKTSRERGGTGLGLAIAKHILNRHRGALRITSVLGKGSTFMITIPEDAPATAAGSNIS